VAVNTPDNTGCRVRPSQWSNAGLHSAQASVTAEVGGSSPPRPTTSSCPAQLKKTASAIERIDLDG
jgi:hypothetical protein